MASNLTFLNKNLFRKYPFQATASLVSSSGVDLPLDLISSASISTTLSISNLYVSQVILNNGTVSITIEHYNSNPADCVTIGCFTGQITEDFQVLELTPFVPYVSGFLMMGGVTTIAKLQGFYTFAYADAVLEPSVVFCYTPPAVTSVTANNTKIQGHLTFGTLVNLTKTISATPDNIFQFGVIDTSAITSLADFSSEFRNCPTPCITNINGITPYMPDATSENNNNIYLFGINPISFDPVLVNPDASPETYTINITTPGVDLNTICAARSYLIPPVAPNFLINRAADGFVGISRYYSKSQTPVVNFLDNKTPEYLLWPNYLSTFTKSITNPTNGTVTIYNPATDTPLLTSSQSATVKEVIIQVSTGSVISDFNLYNSPNTTQIIGNNIVTDEGIVLLPTVNSTFVPTTCFTVNLSSVTGNMVYSVTVLYQITVD